MSRDETSFKDHFSDKSALYARHRPHYPTELFCYLAGLCGRHQLAWDCGTGNGQAAVSLCGYFENVVGTDASSEQIAEAVSQPGLSFRVATAEASGFDDNSVDLVTVGQALHWFDHERFFAEAQRVAINGGVLAVWCYGLCRVSEACDAIVDTLYEDIVGSYWPPERELIEQAYSTVEMPAADLNTPLFEMTMIWSVADMLAYLRTWSACKRFERDKGRDPVSKIERELLDAWGKSERIAAWPLSLRVCRL